MVSSKNRLTLKNKPTPPFSNEVVAKGVFLSLKFMPTVCAAHGKVILVSTCCLSLVADVPDKAPDRVQLETPGYDSPSQTEDTQGAR